MYGNQNSCPTFYSWFKCQSKETSFVDILNEYRATAACSQLSWTFSQLISASEALTLDSNRHLLLRWTHSLNEKKKWGPRVRQRTAVFTQIAKGIVKDVFRSCWDILIVYWEGTRQRIWKISLLVRVRGTGLQCIRLLRCIGPGEEAGVD